MSEKELQPVEVELESSLPSPDEIVLDENAVAEIQESIKEATYFDASSMAPLSPKSLVGFFSSFPLHHVSLLFILLLSPGQEGKTM